MSVEKYAAKHDDNDNETLLNESNMTFGNHEDEDPKNTRRLDTDHAADDNDEDEEE